MVLETPVTPVDVLFLGGFKNRVLLPFNTANIWSRQVIAALKDLVLLPHNL